MFSSWISEELLSFYPLPLDAGRITQPESSRRVSSEPSFPVHSPNHTRDSSAPSHHHSPALPAGPGSSASSRVESNDDFIFLPSVAPFPYQGSSLHGFVSSAAPPASATTVHRPDMPNNPHVQPDDWQPPEEDTPDVELPIPVYACGYTGCSKTFRRKEHLKRHIQTIHGDAPAFLRCEFCGKDQFNRLDNLRSHRRLHTLPKDSRRGVEFVPAATPILEGESYGRKRRKL